MQSYQTPGLPDPLRISGLPERICRLPEVKTLTGLSRSTLYAMMADGRFPAPIKLGLRAVGWTEADLSAWLETRKAKREAV